MRIAKKYNAIVRGDPPQPLAGQPKFAGKTLLEWDANWLRVEGDFTVLHSDLRRHVGLFRASFGNSIMYVGKAVEVHNGGLRKRLSDFRRASPSGRQHHGAMRIHDHLKELDLHVLITGAVELAELLKSAMITRHLPPWNMEKKQAELATQAHVRATTAKVRPTLKLVTK